MANAGAADRLLPNDAQFLTNCPVHPARKSAIVLRVAVRLFIRCFIVSKQQ